MNNRAAVFRTLRLRPVAVAGAEAVGRSLFLFSHAAVIASRFVRVILAQGPCLHPLYRYNFYG